MTASRSIRLLCILLLLTGPAQAGEGKGITFAQDHSVRTFNLAEAAFGVTPSGLFTLSGAGWLMWQGVELQNIGCGTFSTRHESRWHFGGGMRFTQAFQGSYAEFTGRGAVKGQILTVVNPLISSLNLAAHVRYRLLQIGSWRHPLTVGVTLDLVGFSVGPARMAVGQEGRQAAVATPNLLLINKNDRGTLNSEFYLAYKATTRLTARLGVGHLATGYALAGNRYQRFSTGGFVGLTYVMGRNRRHI